MSVYCTLVVVIVSIWRTRWLYTRSQADDCTPRLGLTPLEGLWRLPRLGDSPLTARESRREAARPRAPRRTHTHTIYAVRRVCFVVETVRSVECAAVVAATEETRRAPSRRSWSLRRGRRGRGRGLTQAQPSVGELWASATTATAASSHRVQSSEFIRAYTRHTHRQTDPKITLQATPKEQRPTPLKRTNAHATRYLQMRGDYPPGRGVAMHTSNIALLCCCCSTGGERRISRM